jgi:hypothetical protein
MERAMPRVLWILLPVLILGCSDDDAVVDAGPTPDAPASVDGAVLDASADAPPGVDAAGDAAAGADAATCAVTPGTATHSPGCDGFELAVVQHDGAASELIVTGRIFSMASAPCAVIDGVDILAGGVGSTLIQHLEGGAIVPLDSTERELGRGVPAADLIDRCASDDPSARFEAYGVVVSGRIDGGSFVAECALAEGGSRWPPALRVTCHENVDAPARYGYAEVMTYPDIPLSTSSLSATSPHGAGGAWSTVDGAVTVIPLRSFMDPGAPLSSSTISGFTGSTSETTYPSESSSLQLLASENLFGADLCPTGATAAPVFLARFSGAGGHGACSTEAYVGACYSYSTSP